jgi:hypothetical protein
MSATRTSQRLIAKKLVYRFRKVMQPAAATPSMLGLKDRHLATLMRNPSIVCNTTHLPAVMSGSVCSTGSIQPTANKSRTRQSLPKVPWTWTPISDCRPSRQRLIIGNPTPRNHVGMSSRLGIGKGRTRHGTSAGRDADRDSQFPKTSPNLILYHISDQIQVRRQKPSLRVRLCTCIIYT